MSEIKDLQSFVLWDREYKTLIPKKYQDRKAWAPVQPKLIQSIIPGTIREVFVKEGQTVKKGDTLLILESMKMMNQVKASVDGKVNKIHVTTNEKIAKNHLMVELS